MTTPPVDSNGAGIQAKTDDLAERLHQWYLEAIKALYKPTGGEYNPEAVKPFSELSENQQFIDRYIAGKIIDEILRKTNNKTKTIKVLDNKSYDKGFMAGLKHRVWPAR